MTIYYNSGLYAHTFYTRHEINIHADDDETLANIEFNLELLAGYYRKDLGFEYKDEADEKEQVSDMFSEDIESNTTFFEPIVFDEKVAVECFLIPMTYRDRHFLSLPCHSSVDLMPRLDAYQLLTHCSIDKDSRFFSLNVTNTRKYFASSMLGYSAPI